MVRQISAARREIVTLLRREGPQTVDSLSAMVGITPVGVRKHLDTLQIDGLVTSTTERRRIGRPAQLYSLTEAADELFPKAYDTVLASILRQVQRIGGSELMRQVLDGRTDELEAVCRERMEGAATLEERLRILTKVRDSGGYMAEFTRDGDAFRFTEHNCTLCQIARQFPMVCATEFDLLERLLGDKATIERCEHLVDGDRHCTYLIRERAATL